jgi:hypothetical protein
MGPRSSLPGRLLVGAVILIPAFAFAGCDSGSAQRASDGTAGKEETILTPHAAQFALRTLFANPDSGKKTSSVALMTIAKRPDEMNDLDQMTISKEDPEQVWIGHWECDLRKHTFKRLFQFADFDEGINGSFQRDEAGVWKAQIDGVMFACRKRAD